MHDAWFSTGAPVPTGTVQCIFVVPPNTQTDPNADGGYVINPSGTVFTAQDIYQRPIPATTTLKIQVVENNQGSTITNPITNTAAFYTYTGPFTLIQALPSATVGPSYYMASRAFDTVTGDGIQTPQPDLWNTVPNNPDA
jgi:hypothetical protein